MAKAKGKKAVTQVRRMPRHEVDFFLEEEWDGWEFKADTYLPQGKWLEPIVAWEEQLTALRQEAERLEEKGEGYKDGSPEMDELLKRMVEMASRQTVILTQSRLHTKRVLQDVITGWNFVDHGGKKLALNAAGWDSLPQQLLEDMWFKYIDYITNPPKAGSGE